MRSRIRGRRWHAAALASMLAATAAGGCGLDHGEVDLQGSVGGRPVEAVEAVFFTVAIGSFEPAYLTRIVLAPFDDACAALSHNLWQSPSQGIWMELHTLGPFGWEAIQSPVDFEGVGIAWTVRADSRCAPRVEQESDGGTLSITAVTDTSMDGKLRVGFGTDVVTATFRAAACKSKTAAPEPFCK